MLTTSSYRKNSNNHNAFGIGENGGVIPTCNCHTNCWTALLRDNCRTSTETEHKCGIYLLPSRQRPAGNVVPHSQTGSLQHSIHGNIWSSNKPWPKPHNPHRIHWYGNSGHQTSAQGSVWLIPNIPTNGPRPQDNPHHIHQWRLHPLAPWKIHWLGQLYHLKDAHISVQLLC